MISRSRPALLLITIIVTGAAALLARVTFAAAPAAQGSTDSRFPPGPGRDALFRACANCHGPESVLGHLKTRGEWSNTLDDMANNGAEATDEEWDQILTYLDRNYSLILVNKATAKDLELTLGVTPAIAEAIVRRRTDIADFTSIDELKQVPGVVAKDIDARKDRFVF